MARAAEATRRYSGSSAEERRAQRRERLLDAGLELFGTQGYARASIRSISAVAGTNSRYFYESFTSREDLLYHVYDRIVHELIVAAADATAGLDDAEVQARAGLRAAWKLLTDDPRKGRVIAIESTGVSERLDRLRRDIRHSFADLTISNALAIAGEGVRLNLDPVLTARSLIGGVVEVLVDLIEGDVEASPDEIVEHFTQLFSAVAAAAIADEKPSDRLTRLRRLAEEQGWSSPAGSA